MTMQRTGVLRRLTRHRDGADLLSAALCCDLCRSGWGRHIVQAAGERMIVWRACRGARLGMTCRKPHKQSAGAQTATIAAAFMISILLATCLVALRREPSLPYTPSMIEFRNVQYARARAACRSTGPAQPLTCCLAVQGCQSRLRPRRSAHHQALMSGWQCLATCTATPMPSPPPPAGRNSCLIRRALSHASTTSLKQ